MCIHYIFAFPWIREIEFLQRFLFFCSTWFDEEFFSRFSRLSYERYYQHSVNGKVRWLNFFQASAYFLEWEAWTQNVASLSKEEWVESHKEFLKNLKTAETENYIDHLPNQVRFSLCWNIYINLNYLNT